MMKVKTIDNAKKEVLKLVKQGVSFRDISKTKFRIGDRIKHFSIGEISKIKNGPTGKIDVQHRDNDLALAFKLFTKGKTPTQVVMETGLALDFVDQAHEKYLEWEEMVIVTQWFYDYITELAWHVGEVENQTQIYYNLKKAIGIYDLMKEFPVPCSICRVPLELDENMWKSAREYLISNRWYHNRCKYGKT